MTFEQADVLADVFNMLVGRGKPRAFVEEHRDGTCSVRLSNGTGAIISAWMPSIFRRR